MDGRTQQSLVWRHRFFRGHDGASRFGGFLWQGLDNFRETKDKYICFEIINIHPDEARFMQNIVSYKVLGVNCLDVGYSIMVNTEIVLVPSFLIMEIHTIQIHVLN